MFAMKLQSSQTKSVPSVDAKGPAQAENALTSRWARRTLGVQPKVAVSAPGDPSERQANAVAEDVMRMAEPRTQRQCAECASGGPLCPQCAQEAKPSLSRQAESGPGAHQVQVPASSGNPLQGLRALDSASRFFVEPRFGHDFSRVRVHAGGDAADAASAVRARSYTAGRDIAFGAREDAHD